MTARGDVVVDFGLSPRLATILAPATSITLQDIHDTLKTIQELPGHMGYPNLVASAGKEDLGGSLQVGITSTLQNARVAFQARKTFVAAGTVTTADTGGRTLTDSAATFVASGVEVGAWIVNLTDGSVATVLRVDSETSLFTDTLGGGTDNRFDSGDSYRILNVTQCTVGGGNLVAVDSVGLAMSPVLSTAGTQVVRELSTSAALVETLQTGTEYETRARASAILDGSTLRLSAWLVRAGSRVTSPTAATVGLYDDAGALVFSRAMGTPDSRGVFHATQSTTGLGITANRNYTLDVTVTDSTGSRTDTYPQQTLSVT
jgi:hypothetical protein